ncbi:hypothetical protein [Pararobbsia silviterrae]|uniref:Uncharacterized protein n=1 Tax=Pararobbsia silviterrae TaxID=1792498 RepID=A0A494Y0R3_9BURK|nr:hypothetical protein [Pararobbsia silviterrae]RKP56365.1 hypothetical protein D7S86_08170 [Pararobbsia silviterrae]
MNPNSPDGMSTRYHEEDGKVILSYQQDVEAVLKHAHEARVQENTMGRTPDMRRTMTVPTVVLLDIKTRYGWDFMNKDHWPYVAKILKGPEYAAFRTTNKRI